MLKKRSKSGVQAFLKCEKCGKKFKVLYNSSDGKKICEDCLFTEQCLNSTLEKNDEK